ncbi:MAG: hypothetical protein LBT55_05605 [Clostridiaceae bacterium]|nr:hypothetical protein [Clostridiaceae bacterium]
MKKSKILSLLLVAIVIIASIALFAACTDEDVVIPESGAFGTVLNNVDGTVTVYDYDGEPFTFTPGTIQRIVNLWPANTSGALALGAEPYFVARVAGMLTPWQALMFPDYAALTAEVPAAAGPANVEGLMTLEPDLIIGHPSNVAVLKELDYNGYKLPVVNINFTTYDEMKITYKVLGEILGGRVKENANAWGDMLVANIKRISDGLAGVTARPVTYYTAGGVDFAATMGMSALAQSNVVNEWTVAAGGTHWQKYLLDKGIPSTSFLSGQSVNVEFFSTELPDKIFIGGGQKQALIDILAGTSQSPWTGIAVEIGVENCVFMPYALFDWGRFGAESALQILWAARELHPTIFADHTKSTYIDMTAETIAFYKDFVGFEGMNTGYAERILSGLQPNGTIY